MPSVIRIESVFGRAIDDWIGGLAQLRIRVFREFPYLYDGSLAYEQNYLETYTRSAGSIAVLAFDGDTLVGASTGLPMAQAEPEFQQAFVDAGIDIAGLFYCAESVLLPEYRGRGIYREFFGRREAHASSMPGIRSSVFCAVQRPATHPLRPASYQSLDAVWQRFGYAAQPMLATRFSWKDIDQPAESEKVMQFYLKPLV